MSGTLLMPQSKFRSSFLSVPSRLTWTLLSSRKLGVPPVLPGDGGGEGLAVGEGLCGCEPLVCHGEVSLGQFLSVPGNLALVAVAGLGDLEAFKFSSSMVDLHLKAH